MSEETDNYLQGAHDEMRMSAWLHQMSAVWALHRYAAVIEAGALSAWYFLASKGQYVLSTAVLFLGSWLLYLMVLAIRRQAQMLEVHRVPLSEVGILPKNQEKPIGVFGGNWERLYAHEFARLFVATLIIVNSVLAFIDLGGGEYWSTLASVFGFGHFLFYAVFVRWRGRVILRKC